MPSSEEILSGLFEIVSKYHMYALFWHILFYLLIIILFSGWKPTNKILSVILSFPLFSVSIFAWISGNPFNGFMFAFFGLVLLISGLRNTNQKVTVENSFYKYFGILTIIYGLAYPHFIPDASTLTYFYSSPIGLVPCPTLSTIIGFAIFYNGFNSKKWSISLCILGLIYGFVGVFRLNVLLDIGLLLAAVILILQTYKAGVEKTKIV